MGSPAASRIPPSGPWGCPLLAKPTGSISAPALLSRRSYALCSSSTGKVFPACLVHGYGDRALLETCPAHGRGAGSSPDTQRVQFMGSAMATHGTGAELSRLLRQFPSSGVTVAIQQPRAEAPHSLCHCCPSLEPPGNEEMQLALNVRHFTCHRL